MRAIYFDHHSTTPVDPSVESAMRRFWLKDFGNPHSTEHSVGQHAAVAVEKARISISRALVCEPDEIFITSGATEGNNQAIFGVCASKKIDRARKQVVISSIEHKCVHEAARYWCSVFDLDLQMVQVDRFGFVDAEHLENLLQKPTRLVSIMSVNNEIGTVQNLDSISSIAWQAGAIFHSDCAQTLKTISPLRVASSADIATFSGHKMGGPQGIGAIFISAHLQEIVSPLILGGGQQNGMRSGTVPLPLTVGLGKAFENLLDFEEADKRRIHTRAIRDSFFIRLQRVIPEVILNGPAWENRHPGNLHVQFPGTTAVEILRKLKDKVAASSGSACSSGAIEPSHVLRAIGLSEIAAGRSVRFGFSALNSFEELDVAEEEIRDALAR